MGKEPGGRNGGNGTFKHINAVMSTKLDFGRKDCDGSIGSKEDMDQRPRDRRGVPRMREKVKESWGLIQGGCPELWCLLFCFSLKVLDTFRARVANTRENVLAFVLFVVVDFSVDISLLSLDISTADLSVRVN